MGKRRPYAPRGQMAFDFAAPTAPAEIGGLAGLTRWMTATCAVMLSEDPRQRDDIADRMSALLAEKVTAAMLNVYAAASRSDQNIPASRFFALVAVTGRFDLLDQALTKVGARALQGDEMATAKLGHLYALRAELDEQIKEVRPLARPLRGGRR